MNGVTIASAAAYFLFFLVSYNLAKLPWYVGLAKIPSYGLEASMPFHSLTGYRGPKLWSHPVLFLVLHTVMGSGLLVLYALLNLLSGKQQQTAGSASSILFFALAVIFALHIVPESAGIPNRTKKLPLNEACVAIVMLGAGLAVSGLVDESTGRTIVIIPCLGAPVLELLPVIKFLIKKIQNPSFKGTSKDGDAPLKRNMSGYSGCPFAKLFDISTSEYPSSPSKKE